MKILFYQDDTLDLNLDGLVTGLNSASNGRITFREGTARFHISGSSIRYSGSYEQLSRSFVKQAEGADLSICFTKTPYDNNYFFSWTRKTNNCLVLFVGTTNHTAT